MASFLVVYGTGEGQTAKVANRITARLENRGHDVVMVDIESISDELSIDAFDAALIGSSIHVGKHHSAIPEFLASNREALHSRPTAFFQLSLSSAVDDEERRAEAAAYVDGLLEEADWHPDRIGLFGGALRYSKYGFLKRLLMKRIAKDATGDVDTARDYEYTDWNEVEAFADDFAAFVEGREGDDGGRGTAEAGNQ
ncbi:flavodoxin domain-containing protein [Halopiger xanaduensis]|uniref:Flavodoxin/nitric oxide synthase n=1 Tax=Halopiger xanaduensis (strain DSM 18323 / JCM 14033 / SH-6) TaxID=797210 RepID=F8DE06_HALXS|nr:flavodoxin domain-containing protein [Halopiger xanaduensis]AEH39093.1 flavodoxin/nitric oxide synthase [Halopiger xanaduensis SH-6]